MVYIQSIYINQERKSQKKKKKKRDQPTKRRCKEIDKKKIIIRQKLFKYKLTRCGLSLATSFSTFIFLQDMTYQAIILIFSYNKIFKKKLWLKGAVAFFCLMWPHPYPSHY